MKKKMVLALALVLLAVAGCGKNATPGGNQGSNTPQASNPSVGGSSGNTNPSGPSSGGTSGGSTAPNQTPKSTYEKANLGPLKMGDVAKVGPLEVKVTNVVVKKKAPGLPPNSTLVYALVMVSVKNTGTEDYVFNLTEHFKFLNAEGKTYVFNTPATNTEQQRLNGTVKPGQTSEGYIGYMVKLVAGTNKFVYVHPDWGTATWEYQS